MKSIRRWCVYKQVIRHKRMKLTLFALLILMNCSSPKREITMSEMLNIYIIESDYHKDIKVKIPSNNFEKICDSYYFNLDNSITMDEGYGKVRFGLSELLNSWVYNLKSLKSDSALYLPIDFSDQYIGGFKVELIKENSIKINYGISEDLGSGEFPSNPKGYFKTPKNFQLDDEFKEYVVEKDKFIKSIELSINRIK